MSSFKHNLVIAPLHGCQSRANDRKTNRQHERYFQIIYSDKQSSFETMLVKDGSVSVHHRKFQILATEMYRTKNDLSLLIVSELFKQKNEHHCDLRNSAQFTIPPMKPVYHGSESISFLGPKIWNILPDRLKFANSTEVFKMQIKNGNLKIAHVSFARYMFKMSVLFKEISIKRKERKISCDIKTRDCMDIKFIIISYKLREVVS